MHYPNEPLVVEQPYQLIELPEINKSSATDERAGVVFWLRALPRPEVLSGFYV
jgi:hypothetical protein